MWRFGNLHLDARSGRLLLRGPNGTGKTTALEALWPYLLDLDASHLAAGKSRPTSLTSLMREGATGKRRTGYAWMTLAEPDGGLVSFGARIVYADGGSPPVRVVPFTVPGLPLRDVPLYVANRGSMTPDQFRETVSARGGEIFDHEDAYLAHLAVRVFATEDTRRIRELAQRLREIRNPSRLGDVTPQGAAEALRESLPGVSDEAITATADALEESKTTRDAFEHDREAAEILGRFADAWSGYAVEVVGTAHGVAAKAENAAEGLQQLLKRKEGELRGAETAVGRAATEVTKLEQGLDETRATIEVLEKHEAYQEARRREGLARELETSEKAAARALDSLIALAAGIARAGNTVRDQARHLIEDIDALAAEVAGLDPSLRLQTPIVALRVEARAPLTIGDRTADPGPSLTLRGDTDELRTVATRWRSCAKEHEQVGGTAAMALTDHVVVEKATVESVAAAAEASRAQGVLADRARDAEEAGKAAGHAVVLLAEAVTAWIRAHATLSEDLDGTELVQEPAAALATADEWAAEVTSRAEAWAAALRTAATGERKTAELLRAEAQADRDEAAALRSGKLLPLPRPNWAAPSDDERAFAAAVEWAADTVDATTRAILEATMGASGLLGATLTTSGILSESWYVDVFGAPASACLGDVLVPDPSHPAAEMVTSVLARIALAPSALGGDGTAALTIGRDGTFRAGPLFGCVPAAADPVRRAPASHIGARQRRAAALARAEDLDRKAATLEESAAACDERAVAGEAEAKTTSGAGRAFPSRDRLRRAESDRVTAESHATKARTDARKRQEEADRKERIAAEALADWTTRTRGLGLPVNVDALAQLRDDSVRRAAALAKASRNLEDGQLRRLVQIAGSLDTAGDNLRLAGAHGQANEFAREATELRTKLRVIDDTMGKAIAEVVRLHDDAVREEKRLREQVGPAREQVNAATRAEATCRTTLEHTQEELATAIAKAGTALAELRQLLEMPGMVSAVLDGDSIPEGRELLGRVASKLTGRKRRSLRAVRELVDEARAKLARSWAIDPGDDRGELLTWVLTHQDAVYSPPDAAAHALRLKERAEQALAVHEERALRDFVISRLPAAMGTAWTKLRDWREDVNKKMRSASASSGVSVQVRMPRVATLTPHEETVFRLACEVSNAARTVEQQRELAAALRALLDSADAETMRERVAQATDVRRWLDVYYEVTRADGKSQRWGSRTGLSTGERRLVGLAPMLAAIAAQYDGFGPRALRVVALDEIPVEVDERGRDGLARYMAQLDLDLVSTSHQWDGCPGAWDGIDIHDLESSGGADPTVVAFPMVVRGAGPLPGDDDDVS